MPLTREHIIIPGSPSLPYALLLGGSYHFACPVFCYISFCPFLAKILKETLLLILISGKQLLHDYKALKVNAVQMQSN